MDYFWSILTSDGGSEFLGLLATATAKSTVLLASVALLCASFRRSSAATRHLLWISVICASLLLPCLSFLTVWEVPILPAVMSVSSASGSNESIGKSELFETQEVRLDENNSVRENFQIQTNAESLKETSFVPNISNPAVSPPKNATLFLPQLLGGVLAVWFAGMTLLLFRLLIGFSATNLLARRAAEFNDAAYNELFSSLLTELKLEGKARLLRSERTLMPIVCGVLRPAVILPANADEWSKERLKIVLLHELTHAARRDCLTQTLAQIACAFYWFNPLVWYAARRLRVEREQACDDRVLSVGTKPSEYAHHLLEIARSMQSRSVFEWSKAATVAMARKSQLEGRLLAILSKENKPGAVSRTMTFGLVALICFLHVSLAVVRPTFINAQKSQNFKTIPTDVEISTDVALSNSFLTIASKRKVETKIHHSETDESVEKRKNNAADDNPPNQDLSREQVDRDGEQDVNPGNEVEREQSISETVERQIAASIQLPEIIPPPGAEVSPFINAEYRQERRTQNGSEDFIEEMASVGYTNLSIDDLVRLKTAGVTADYVRSLRALGFADLTLKELASMAIHSVTPAYIQALRATGYNELSAKEVTAFRIHDITPEYVKALRGAGYGSLTAKELTSFAVHRVTPAFISGIRATGYGNLSAKEIVSLRVHAISPEFIRQARSRLGELNLKQIIALKNAGIIADDQDKDKD